MHRSSLYREVKRNNIGKIMEDIKGICEHRESNNSQQRSQNKTDKGYDGTVSLYVDKKGKKGTFGQGKSTQYRK